MPGRVLNFVEFSDKYSNGSDEPVSLDDMKNAAANFEEGFDDETYDQPQISPNRPISGNYEMTPSSPGEEGAPSFSSDNSDDMKAPTDNITLDTTEEDLEDESIEEDQPLPAPSSEDDEESDEEEEDESDEEEEDEEHEEGNPEAGANPKKKVDESITLVKSFIQFINEEVECDTCGDSEYMNSDKYAEEDDTCQECGEEYLRNEYGYSCGCNM